MCMHVYTCVCMCVYIVYVCVYVCMWGGCGGGVCMYYELYIMIRCFVDILAIGGVEHLPLESCTIIKLLYYQFN